MILLVKVLSFVSLFIFLYINPYNFPGHVKGWVTEGHAHGQGHQGQDLEPQGHDHLHQGKVFK